MLQHVIDSCKSSAQHLRRHIKAIERCPSVCLLVPWGDPIKDKYEGIKVYEGDEHDVLSRFVAAASKEDADLIVRITSDCYRLPPHTISRAVRAAVIWGTDYTTNTMHRFDPEGWDVQVLSRKMLKWLNENAVSEHDREHVCTAIDEENFPFSIDVEINGSTVSKKSIYHMTSKNDFSHMKLSIDTEDERELALAYERRLSDKFRKAREYGLTDEMLV